MLTKQPIKQKLKECSHCKQQVRLWKSNPPLCKNCNDRVNIRKPIVSRPKKKYKRELAEFFQEMSNYLPNRCDNCREPWGFVAPHFRHWYCAHILPKDPEHGFPSIATDPDNIIYLNPFDCCCHGQYDGKGREYRSQMPVYNKVLERFERLKLKLTDAEIIKAEDYLNINL